MLPRRPDDVLPVERAPANRRDREDHVAQQDLAAAPDTLQALQDELIRDRRLGDLGAIEQAAPPVLQQHQRERAVLAHHSEPAVLYVEGRRAARDRVRGRPGDPPAEIATQRRGVELGEDAAVHAGRAFEQQQIDVVAHVGIILECLGKYELESRRLTRPAHLVNQLEHRPDATLLVGHGFGEGFGQRDIAHEQPFRSACQDAVATRDLQEHVPIDVVPVRRGAPVEQQPQQPRRMPERGVLVRRGLSRRSRPMGGAGRGRVSGFSQHDAHQGALARHEVARLQHERPLDPAEDGAVRGFTGAQIAERVFALARVSRFGADLEQDGHVRGGGDAVQPPEPTPAARAGDVHQRVVEVPIHDEDPLAQRLDVQPVTQEDEQIDRIDETAERPAPDERVAETLQPAHEPRAADDLLERDGPRRSVPRGAGERVPDDAQYRIETDVAVHVEHGDRAAAALQLALEPGDQARFARAVQSREGDQHARFTTRGGIGAATARGRAP